MDDWITSYSEARDFTFSELCSDEITNHIDPELKRIKADDKGASDGDWLNDTNQYL